MWCPSLSRVYPRTRTPSAMYSESPSRLTSGCSGSASAVKTAVRPASRHAEARAKRVVRRPVSSSLSMWRRETESTTRRRAPRRRRSATNSPWSRWMFCLVSWGSSLRISSRPSARASSTGRPKARAVSARLSVSSSRDRKIVRSPSSMPVKRNWRARVVLPVPGRPVTSTRWPAGNPPPIISPSRPMPVGTRAIGPAGSDPLMLGGHQSRPRIKPEHEPPLPVLRDPGEDRQELLDEEGPTALGQGRAHRPAEGEHPVDRIDDRQFGRGGCDPSGEEQVDEPPPLFGLTTQPLEEGQDLHRIDSRTDQEIGQRVDQNEVLGSVPVEDLDEVTDWPSGEAPGRGGRLEQGAVEGGPGPRYGGVLEVIGRKVLESGMVGERAGIARVERRLDL